MNGTEVWVDHVCGSVAIAWPDLPGYWVLDKPVPGLRDRPRRWSYTVPGGMTRVDSPTAGSDR